MPPIGLAPQRSPQTLGVTLEIVTQILTILYTRLHKEWDLFSVNGMKLILHGVEASKKAKVNKSKAVDEILTFYHLFSCQCSLFYWISFQKLFLAPLRLV